MLLEAPSRKFVKPAQRALVHDLDAQTNPRTKPPFRDPGGEPWFALVYAWRIGVFA